MRYSGLLHQNNDPVLPDTTLELLLTAATGQAFDYPSGANLVRITVGSTLAALATPLIFNPATTSATAPTTAGTVSSTLAGQNILIIPGDSRTYQIPGASTGFSLICGSSVSVGMEFWAKHG